jgi:hypothetical protein
VISSFRPEADLPTLLWCWPFERTQRPEDIFEDYAVDVDPSLDLIDPMSEFGRLLKRVSQLNESPHDQDVHGDSSFAAKDARQHGHTLLSERVGQVSPASVPIRTCGRNLRPQDVSLGAVEPEHEIVRKSALITTDRLIEPFGGHAIESRQIRVEHHPLAANDVDPSLDPRGDGLGRHSDVIGAPLLA